MTPAQARDKFGETLGGLGSAIAFKRGSFKQGTNGTFTGTLITQPDRGYNMYVQAFDHTAHLPDKTDGSEQQQSIGKAVSIVSISP